VTEAPPERLDVESHTEYLRRGIHWRVLVNGQDVTEDCVSAVRGDPGSAVVFDRTPDGHIVVDPDDPMRGPLQQTLTGKVEFVQRERGEHVV
jgi:hypothetical protein